MLAKALLPALLLSLTTLSAPAGAIPPPPDPLCPLPEGTVVLCVTVGEPAFDREFFFVDLVEGVPVAGYVDRYRIDTGGPGDEDESNDLVIPCVSLIVDDVEVDPCRELGFEFIERVGGIADTVDRPQASTRTVVVYEATVDALVLGFGADDEEILLVKYQQLCDEFQVSCTAST